MAAADVRPPDEANWLVNPARRLNARALSSQVARQVPRRSRCAGQLKRRCLHGWVPAILLRASVPCTFDKPIGWHSRIENFPGAFHANDGELL